MKEGSRRFRTWKALAILASAFGLAFLALWLWADRVAAHKWAAMERSVEEWIVEAKSRDARRPVLQGDPIPGNAWDDYEIASKSGAMLKVRSVSHNGVDDSGKGRWKWGLVSNEPISPQDIVLEIGP